MNSMNIVERNSNNGLEAIVRNHAQQNTAKKREQRTVNKAVEEDRIRRVRQLGIHEW